MADAAAEQTVPGAGCSRYQPSVCVGIAALVPFFGDIGTRHLSAPIALARSSELCSQLHSELSSLLCSLLAHILGALSSLTGFAGTLLPFFVQDVLHSSRSWVGIAITAQYAAATIGLATIGLLSDHYGHRRTLLGVMALNVCALNMQGWVRSIPTLIVARITLGLVSSYGIGLTWVSRQAKMICPPHLSHTQFVTRRFGTHRCVKPMCHTPMCHTRLVSAFATPCSFSPFVTPCSPPVFVTLH